MNLQRLVRLSEGLKVERQTGRSFHTSFVFKGPKLLALGINSYKQSELISRLPKYKKYKSGGDYNAGLHSEVAAAKQLDFDCEGLTLVNIRIDNNGKPAYSAPCPNCWEYVVEGCGFKKVIFSSNDGWKVIKL